MAFTGAYSSSERNEICRLIRSCYGVSAHNAVRLMRLYSDNLDAVLDTLGNPTIRRQWVKWRSIRRSRPNSGGAMTADMRTPRAAQQVADCRQRKVAP